MNDEEEHFKSYDLSKIARENIITVHVNEFDESSFRTFYGEFSEAERSEQSVIPVIIDSFGGDVYTLLSMVDLMRSVSTPVATIAMGKAMSAGAFLLAAGTPGYRYASPHCSIMVHEVSSGIWAKNSELKQDAKETDRLNTLLFEMLDSNCSKQKGFWSEIVKENRNADLYITSYKAKEYGMVDYVKVPRIKPEVNIKTVLA